jgi:hypothetical protein
MQGIGYICTNCFEELITYKETWDTRRMLNMDVRPLIESFMGTDPGTYVPSTSSNIDDEFKRIVGD